MYVYKFYRDEILIFIFLTVYIVIFGCYAQQLSDLFFIEINLLVKCDNFRKADGCIISILWFWLSNKWMQVSWDVLLKIRGFILSTNYLLVINWY